MLRNEQARQNPEAPEKVRDLFMEHFSALDPKQIISGTMPIKEELDPWPLLTALAKKGHPLCLPIHREKGTPLVFRAHAIGDALDTGQWGIKMPPPSQPEVTPDILLMPLLAFDQNGGRLGYGGGYYDATLRILRQQKKVMAIGIGFAAQEVEEVPMGAFDQRLDAVITEKKVIVPDAGQA